MASPTPPGDKKSSKIYSENESVGGAGVRDVATDRDDLGFGPYVKCLAAFLTHNDTKPPLTVSVEGPWGCGKSSFMLQLMHEVSKRTMANGKPPKPVWFNAWRLDKEEALWAAFVLLVTQSLARDLPWYRRIGAHLKLQIARFDWKKGWFGVTRFVLLAAFLIYTLVSAVRYFSAHGEAINRFSPTSIFYSHAALQLENLALRHQIGVLQRCARAKFCLHRAHLGSEPMSNG